MNTEVGVFDDEAPAVLASSLLILELEPGRMPYGNSPKA